LASVTVNIAAPPSSSETATFPADQALAGLVVLPLNAASEASCTSSPLKVTPLSTLKTSAVASTRRPRTDAPSTARLVAIGLVSVVGR
jgi:hypothetical protein